MKNKLLTIALIATNVVSAQMYSTLENLNLNDNTYLNGSEATMGTTYSDNFALYHNVYDTSFGGYWASGWAISTMIDVTTAGFSNLYSSIAGSGHNSRTYAVGQQNAWISLNPSMPQLDSIYITNSTYAALSMRDGDDFAKKFGGVTGNDPDFFRLIIRAYSAGVQRPDSVVFYLADYRFEDNSLDYIVNDWRAVNINALGGALDSLNFELQSSDVGAFGMNTPAFFCIDDLYSSIACIGISEKASQVVSVYPNPFNEQFSVKLDATCEAIEAEIYTIDGQLVSTKKLDKMNHSVSSKEWESGIYIFKWKQNGLVFQQRIVKQ
ncbi:MAG: hypothetical protein RL264_2602 [Bacteroidota bacterium]|jgi:hypothetical protein